MSSPEITVGTDGWVSVAVDAQHECRVRFQPDEDGRLVTTDVHVHGPEITPALLRGIKLARIQAAALGIDDFYLLVDEDGTEHIAEAPRERLSRPDGTDPEGFYRHVAAAYAEYAPRSKAPAKAIATEANVPITTAHRWVRESRRRGFLPTGRKGKVG